MTFVRFLLLISFLGLLSCSSPADKALLNYEQSLCHTDSLLHAGVVDSTHAVSMVSDLHCKYERVKELSGGKRVRLIPSSKKEKLISGILTLALLVVTLVDRDEVVERLRRIPKFLSDADWEHLKQLTDKAYSSFTDRLTEHFPVLTAADLQLCQLIRLRFSNAEIATLIAVSPASVSQQKFRLKKRLLQVDEALFNNGETVDMFVWGY